MRGNNSACHSHHQSPECIAARARQCRRRPIVEKPFLNSALIDGIPRLMADAPDDCRISEMPAQERTVIKDILVNLSTNSDRDPARDYAISVAERSKLI